MMTINGAIYGFLMAVFAAVAVAVSAGGPGAMDPTFGQGGETVVQPNPLCSSGCVQPGGSEAQAVALGPSGSVILAGNSSGRGFGAARSWLARLAPDGTLDHTFGTAGYAEGEPAFGMSRVFVTNDGTAVVVVTQPGGGFGLERFSPSGVLDPSFGRKGVHMLAGSVQAPVEAAFDSRGRIVVLGTAAGGRPAVARFLPSGEPDASFGHRGVARIAPLGDGQPLRVAAEPNGAIIVAGTAFGSSRTGASQILLARVTNSGAPDSSFGRKGAVKVSGAFHGDPDVLAAGPDQAIYLASSTLTLRGSQRENELVVARYTRHGLDWAFGVRGLARTVLRAGRGLGLLVHAIAFEPSGNAVLVGEHRERSIDVRQGSWFIARYTRHGRDCSFGSQGSVEGLHGGASAVTVQANQRIVIAGWGPDSLPSGAGLAFMAARYVGGPAADTCSGK